MPRRRNSREMMQGARVKQVLQSLKSGAIEVADVPRPAVTRGHLLVQTSRTLISAGTQRVLGGVGPARLLNKARPPPGGVREGVGKIPPPRARSPPGARGHKANHRSPFG